MIFSVGLCLPLSGMSSFLNHYLCMMNLSLSLYDEFIKFSKLAACKLWGSSGRIGKQTVSQELDETCSLYSSFQL